MNNNGLEDSLISTLHRYADGRKNDVRNRLESAELSALLVEKYAVGMVDAVRILKSILGLNIDINSITIEADDLCRSIDSKTEENRQLRYQRFAKLDLSSERETL
jgi:hypothetical protein